MLPVYDTVRFVGLSEDSLVLERRSGDRNRMPDPDIAQICCLFCYGQHGNVALKELEPSATIPLNTTNVDVKENPMRVDDESITEGELHSTKWAVASR